MGMRGEQGQGGYNHGIAILGQRSGSHREARQRQGRATEARGHGSNEHVIRSSSYCFLGWKSQRRGCERTCDFCERPVGSCWWMRMTTRHESPQRLGPWRVWWVTPPAAVRIGELARERVKRNTCCVICEWDKCLSVLQVAAEIRIYANTHTDILILLFAIWFMIKQEMIGADIDIFYYCYWYCK